MKKRKSFVLYHAFIDTRIVNLRDVYLILSLIFYSIV